ncbi:MAG: hypothetical protein HYY37_01130 [Candidatus Aenigmarchaeota archaeon]|nr:hypothetical protein [Candidatus Aenigmarchaeota archaeon]
MQDLMGEIGLTKNEAKIYLNLLRSGSSRAGRITEATGIHRRNVYDALERLMQKGLVSFVTMNSRKLFHATEPERLLQIVEEQKKSIEESRRRLEKEIHKLKPHRREHGDVKVFKGREGIKTVFEDILAAGENYAGYGPGEQIEKVLRFYMPGYVRRRMKKNIKPKLIYNESAHNRRYTSNPMLECRFLPDEFSSHAALRIYGSKVAIILFSEDEPLAIVIENKSIAEGYRKYFNVMWNAAKK